MDSVCSYCESRLAVRASSSSFVSRVARKRMYQCVVFSVLFQNGFRQWPSSLNYPVVQFFHVKLWFIRGNRYMKHANLSTMTWRKQISTRSINLTTTKCPLWVGTWVDDMRIAIDVTLLTGLITALTMFINGYFRIMTT